MKFLCMMGIHFFKYDEEMKSERWVEKGDIDSLFYNPEKDDFRYSRDVQIGRCKCGKMKKNYLD